MAIKKVMLGSLGPFLYDDSKPITDPTFSGLNQGAIVTDGGVVTGDGATGSFTVITSLRFDSGTLQRKARTVTVSNGAITSLGTESDWVNV